MLFISCWKIFSFLRHLRFCPNFFVMQKHVLIRNLVSFKIYDVTQTGQQIITIHKLPNISRSKGNQTMKVCQLIEYIMRNIFRAKSYTQCGGEASPRPFFKKSKLSIYLGQRSEMRKVYFYFMLNSRSTKIH